MVNLEWILPALAGLAGGFTGGIILARALAAKKITALTQQNITLEAQKDSLEKQMQMQKEGFSDLQKQSRDQFENLARKILEETTRQFGTESEKSLHALLSPLKERIGEFQKKVDESFGNEAKERYALQNEIKRIVEVNERMTLQTESLTKALKGDVKLQGNWGEFMLEKILEQSGLREGTDYVVQGKDMGLKNEDGKIIRPDVIVNLPDGKHIIIDSKVTLTDYERFFATDDDAEKTTHIRNFVASIRRHVTGLEERKYQSTDQLGTPDFVLMFVPIEGAYSLAVQNDPALQSFAWDKKIVIVSPATLFATLRTVASSWQMVKQNKNAEEIALQGGRLYDKFVAFVEDLQTIGTQLGRTQKAYDDALGKLKDGKGNLLARVEKIRKLGAKTTKAAPITSDEDFDDDDQDDGKIHRLSS